VDFMPVPGPSVRKGRFMQYNRAKNICDYFGKDGSIYVKCVRGIITSKVGFSNDLLI
jgi:hypothetical protein